MSSRSSNKGSFSASVGSLIRRRGRGAKTSPARIGDGANSNNNAGKLSLPFRHLTGQENKGQQSVPEAIDRDSAPTRTIYVHPPSNAPPISLLVSATHPPSVTQLYDRVARLLSVPVQDIRIRNTESNNDAADDNLILTDAEHISVELYSNTNSSDRHVQLDGTCYLWGRECWVPGGVRSRAVPVTGCGGVVQAALGSTSLWVVNDARQVWSTTIHSHSPRFHNTFNDGHVIALRSGFHTTVAICDNGNVFTYAESGPLRSHDFQILPPACNHRIVDCAVGMSHILFLCQDGSALSIGSNKHGVCGQDIKDATESWDQVDPVVGISGITSISAGMYHSAAVCGSNGRIMVWGDNSTGQLGTGDKRSRNKPVVVSLLRQTKITQVSCGAYHTAVLTEHGQVYVWGNNKHGCLGVGASPATLLQPRRVGLTLRVHRIVAGSFHTMFMLPSGKILGSGYNRYGQLGIDGIPYVSRPSDSDGVPRVQSIFAGGNQCVGICGSGWEQQNICRVLRQLWEQQEYSDSHIGDIPVHKAIVQARCLDLEEDWSLFDHVSSNALKSFVYFLYHDDLPVESKSLEEILELANHINLERLQILCRNRMNDDNADVLVPPISHMISHIYNMMATPISPDVFFHSTSYPFPVPAHRAILAYRCPFFKIMFESGMSEVQTGHIMLDPDTNVETFSMILEYLYTGNIIEWNTEEALQLLVLAIERYELPGLAELAENVVRQAVDHENVKTVQKIAHIVGSDSLETFCSEYIEYYNVQDQNCICM
eukprot:gb/GECH01006625.1/.p1 GENE.gb/GECH01006625.1/~~gb/GECH01006625.1/.p1  ORF type:complete len:769 (+),score=99.98 gb/GECH01006625.1/:1-2307(+)